MKKIQTIDTAKRENYFIKSSGNCIENLCAAIILQAVHDFRKYAERYHAGIDKEKMKYEMNKILNFILSDWYAQLTSIPSERLIKQLMKEFNEMKAGGDIGKYNKTT